MAGMANCLCRGDLKSPFWGRIVVTTMTAGQAVAEALVQLGVRHVFGMAGSCLLEILDRMYDHEELHFMTVRHEQAAALMADGYGRMTGRPGVCLANNGPGAMNMVTGVANAMLAQSPVLAITGAPMMKDMFRDSSQEIDQVAVFRPLVKWSVQVRKGERAADVIREAYQVAISGVPGPVHVDLPRDVMNEDVEFSGFGEALPVSKWQPSPNPEDLATAADLLRRAERPVLIGGGGVIWAEASDDLVALAEKLGAPILASTGRDDIVPNSHPLYIGALGRALTPKGRAMFREADVVLAVGTRLAHTSTYFSPDFFGPSTKLIHAAVDPRTIGRNYPVELGLVGDAGLILRGLNRELGNIPQKPGWKDATAEIRAEREQKRQAALAYTGTPIDPRLAHMALAKVLPKGTVIAADVGAATGFMYGIHQFEQPRSLLSHRDFVAIGVAYALGLGAKVACPDRPVVTICGDGAFLINGVEIETAVREGINTVGIVMNNFTLGSERAYQHHYYGDRFIGEKMENPPFDEFARVFGAAGYRVTDPADLEDVFAQAIREEKPTIVDVICDPDIFQEPGRRETIKSDRRKVAATEA